MSGESQETIQQNPDSIEHLYRRNPEIIANPPLKNTEIVYSIPTYDKEWTRGTLARSMLGMLSQHPDSNSAIEINYIVNIGDHHSTDFDYYSDSPKPIVNSNAKDMEKFNKAQEAISFIRDIVSIQKAARSQLVNDSQNEVNQIIEKYTDPQLREILLLAQKRADQVAISAVDSTKSHIQYELGYYENIEGFRTLGRDYAVSRFKDKANGVIFVMSDTDTIPAYNRTSADIIKIYKSNPNIKYHFIRVGYQPPGESKGLVSTTTEWSGSKIVNYNTGESADTPQITMRISAADEIKDIAKVMASGSQGDEDRDTAQRLIGMYGGMSEPLIMTNLGERIPIQLPEDRTEGLSDGSHRDKDITGKLPKSFEVQVREVEERYGEQKAKIEAEVNALSSDDIKNKLENERKHALLEIHKTQLLQNRFNRQVFSDFLLIRSELPLSGSQVLTDKTVQKILEQKRGLALLNYIQKNRELVSTIDDNDIAVIQFFLGQKDDLPQGLELSTFHKTIREYIGEFNATDPRKQVVMQPIMAEAMALGHIHSLYSQRKFLHEGSTDQTLGPHGPSWFEAITNYSGRFPDRDTSWAISI